jgi:DNA-binding winged helix-turn-helix (wHTH) protein
MEVRLRRPKSKVTTVAADDDRALAEFIRDWLERRGLQATPLEALPDIGRNGHADQVDGSSEANPSAPGTVGPAQRSAFADLVYVPEDPEPGPFAEQKRNPWVDPLPRMSLGPLDIDTGRHSVRVLGQDIHLTPTEFRLLCYLVEHSDRVVGHRELLLAVWGPGYGDDTHLLQVTIRSLRSRLADVNECPLIESVYATGYRMANWPDPKTRIRSRDRASGERS